MMKLAACSIVFASMSLLTGCATEAQQAEPEAEASEALTAAQACDAFNKCIESSWEVYNPSADKSVSKFLGAICKRAIAGAPKGEILGKCVEGAPGREGAGLSCWESANFLKCALPRPTSKRQNDCIKRGGKIALGGDIACFVTK
jgi:hypothetical protein